MARPPSVKKQASAPGLPFAAFLRGINVGGRVIKMAELKKVFVDSDLQDVKTIGASGNVIFSAAGDEAALTNQIECALHKTFKASIAVQVRSMNHLRELVASDPFKRVRISPNTRLYVSFSSAAGKSKSGLRIPYSVPGKDMSILSVSKTEIFSFVNLSEKVGTLDLMELVETEFGKTLTTRNWNTVGKVAA